MERECHRCGGLKVAERFYGTDSTVAAWACDGFRCLNCGAVWFTEQTFLNQRSVEFFVKEQP